jgi:translation elongation factor EF-Ts
LKNDDLSEAVKFIRARYGISMLDAKNAIMDAKGTFSDIQITKLLEYIYENEPEYVI